MTCAHIFFPLLCIRQKVVTWCFYVCSYLYLGMRLIMISMNYACAVVLFIQFQLLFPPQTTLQRRVSGHLAVNKLELIDFNSGQHPSAKHSPGSVLNKLPPGTDFRSAVVIYVWWCVCVGGRICQVKKKRLWFSFVSLNVYPYTKQTIMIPTKQTERRNLLSWVVLWWHEGWCVMEIYLI